MDGITPPKKNWLTQKDYALANQLCQSCAVTDDLVTRLRAIGLPVDDQAAQNDFHRQVGEGVKKHFFPEQP